MAVMGRSRHHFYESRIEPQITRTRERDERGSIGFVWETPGITAARLTRLS